ncbi:hypothetical protein N7540_008133 [Penicillium herquei]|nr:hypothetical protein N7540_008133 [Penicillium herquei]
MSQSIENIRDEIDIDEWDTDDTDHYRDNVPEYFEFPCCKTLDVNPPGCKYDWHVEQPLCIDGVPALKKARVY